MAKWYEYETLWQAARRKFSRQLATMTMEQYYANLYHNCSTNKIGHDAKYYPLKAQHEYQWLHDKRPYYKLYPGVITPFLRLDVDKVDLSSLKVPTGSTLMIQIPVGSIVTDGIVLRNILIRSIRTKEHRESTEAVDGMLVTYEYSKEGSNEPYGAYFTLPFVAGKMLGAYLGNRQRCVGDVGSSIAMRNNVLRIIAVCSLLEDDPDVIQPDVLAGDYEKWKIALDPKYIEKAKQRGKFGWVIGKNVEVSPHIRAASPFALYWTGKGRTIPIIRHRKSCIVHREIIEKIPTGYEE
jgi:hypothetical protein